MNFHPDGFTRIISVNTGLGFWVPDPAVPMLTDRASNHFCAEHGHPLAEDGDESSVIDVIAEQTLQRRYN